MLKNYGIVYTTLLLIMVEAQPVDFMRNTGKIYVVFGVIIIIFIGIALFLGYLERKIRRIEKRLKNDEKK